MTTRIIEVIGRSTQGITLPFLCRGDDGWPYYVKANAAGRSALIAEWIAGHITPVCWHCPIPMGFPALHQISEGKWSGAVSHQSRTQI